MKKNNWRSILSIILGIIVIFVSIVMIKSLDVSVAKYKLKNINPSTLVMRKGLFYYWIGYSSIALTLSIGIIILSFDKNKKIRDKKSLAGFICGIIGLIVCIFSLIYFNIKL
jgi:multisubunit Na+/H+ antiporter MnhB subunit